MKGAIMTSENAAPAEMPGVEEMLAAYNAVWHSAPGVDAHNVDIVRHEAMRAVHALFAPILAEKKREIASREPTAFAIELGRKLATLTDRADAAEARALAAEAALEPFARIDSEREAGHAFDAWADDRVIFGIGSDRVITAGDLRRTRAVSALAQIAAPGAAMEAPDGH